MFVNAEIVLSYKSHCPWHAALQIVPILRAGLVLLEQAATVLPSSETYHVGHIRDEVTMQVNLIQIVCSAPPSCCYTNAGTWTCQFENRLSKWWAWTQSQQSASVQGKCCFHSWSMPEYHKYVMCLCRLVCTSTSSQSDLQLMIGFCSVTQWLQQVSSRLQKVYISLSTAQQIATYPIRLWLLMATDEQLC